MLTVAKLRVMILAIDVGGTKTLVASIDSDGKTSEEIRFETPKTYSDFLNQLKSSIGSLKHQRHSACVIAMPGLVDRRAGVVKYFGNLPWTNVPILDDLKTTINIPTYVENDANLAGLSEANLLPNYRKVLYITVSTGIGGVLVVKGHIEPSSQDAEYGQMLLEHEGHLQRWEKFASGSAIYQKYGKRAADIDSDSDWYVIARNIAVGLIDVIAATTPDVVVLGGGVGSHFDKFGDKLINELEIYENNLVKVPPIVGAKDAEQAVIHGCFVLAKQKRHI